MKRLVEYAYDAGYAAIHQGDCLDLMPSCVAGASVDLVLCDLPYGTTNCQHDEVIPFDRLWAEYRRVLKPGGCVVLFGSQPFTSKLVLSNEAWFRYSLVWNKNKCGSPGLARHRPMKVHEDILVFSPGRTVYNPQMETGEPYSRRSKNAAGYVGKHNRHGYGLKPKTEFVNTGTRYPKSVINISRDFSAQQQVHQHQKPVPLMAWLVKTYSNPGDVVLDNAMGGGSTGVACVDLGRSFVGFEIDPASFGVAKNRIEQKVQARSAAELSQPSLAIGGQPDE